MTLNINLFGGPGTGKSTTAAELFAHLKKDGHRVELIQEYAKDLTYGKDQVRLNDQLHVLVEQHHRLVRVLDEVDYVVHDSPFVIGVTYLQKSARIPTKAFAALAVDLFNMYDNLNIFLRRDLESHPYQEYGRSQSLQEALEKDDEIKAFLVSHNIPFTEISVGDLQGILATIKETNGRNPY